MKYTRLFLAAFVMLLVFSCSRQEPDNGTIIDDYSTELLTFKAAFGEFLETKTEFESSEASSWPVYWLPGDAINIFYGSRSEARFETVEDFTEADSVTEFEGYLKAATGAADENGNVTTQNFWGLYPYNENNTCDGSSVTLTIPSEQEGVAGTFANGLNPSIACSPNMSLTFFNVGSWFIFTVTQENVVSATLTGANGETLVGKVKVSMDGNNRPRIDEVTEGSTTVTMTPEDGSFQVGEYYCMVILPGTYDDGVVLTLTKGDGTRAECAVKRTDGSPMVIERSKWARKKNADDGLVYKQVPQLDGHEYVDMGDGLKWATCNVGSSSPEESGDYYAWGETSSKDDYSYETYDFTRPFNDAASINWGTNWRIPTDNEWLWLIQNCEWEWTIKNGVNGCKITSTLPGYEDNSVFLPAAGLINGPDLHGAYGEYWSSLVDENPKNAWRLFFGLSNDSVFHRVIPEQRWFGRSVRPIVKQSVPVRGVSINETAITLSEENETKELTATVIPSDASISAVLWSSSDPSVATVSPRGIVTAISNGTAIIRAQTVDNSYSASCEVTVDVIKNSISGHDYVEMAPGFFWATCNLGADNPEDFGDYFSWGENDPYYSSVDPLTWESDKINGYSWSSYTKFTIDNGNSFNKYTVNDGLSILESEDDAASNNWGPEWRIPSDGDWRILMDEDLFEWTSYNVNVQGTSTPMYRVTSKVPGYEGNQIILPSVRYMDGKGKGAEYYYWSSKLSYTIYYRGDKQASVFRLNDKNFFPAYRCYGCVIRPVSGSAENYLNGYEYVDMGNGLKWATLNLGASKTNKGSFWSWAGYTSKGDYNWKRYEHIMEGEDSWVFINKYTIADGKTEGIWYNESGEFIGDNKKKYSDYGFEDDVVRLGWEATWRTPTPEEWEWLLDNKNCRRYWTTRNGIYGWLFESVINGNVLFFPQTGHYPGGSMNLSTQSYYWTSSLSNDDSSYARALKFNDNSIEMSTLLRCYGAVIRPVSD